jgi:hypothetical protein
MGMQATVLVALLLQGTHAASSMWAVVDTNAEVTADNWKFGEGGSAGRSENRPLVPPPPFSTDRYACLQHTHECGSHNHAVNNFTVPPPYRITHLPLPLPHTLPQVTP